MNNDDSKIERKSNDEGYNARPLWQWIAIYIIGAIVLYGIIYWIFTLAGY